MTATDIPAAVARKLLGVRTGKLWWRADSMEEARKWGMECSARGAISYQYFPDSATGIGGFRFILTLYRDETANYVAGYEIGEKEWLEE